MSNIKILDCTLRDGGYVNNWDFGRDVSKSVLSLLSKANIDFIEAGFLSDATTNVDMTVFNSIYDVAKILPDSFNTNKLVLMIKTEQFDVAKLPNASCSDIKTLRIIFKKHKLKEGLQCSKMLMDKGYKIFINPTFSNQYTQDDFLRLIKKINEIKPFAFTIVDSIGSLDTDNTLKLHKIFDENLNKEIALCYHFHNNLQLCYSNACTLAQTPFTREVIIDSTLHGIGRGAGNLCSELLIQFLNTNNKTKYDIKPVLEAINNFILPIYNKTPWGYSMPYFLSAKNGCHPNYAKFLSENGKLSYAQMSSILKAIPQDKKAVYNEECISTLFSLMTI